MPRARPESAPPAHPSKRNRPIAAGEVGVPAAYLWCGVLLAGGVAEPHGDFHSSMQLMETGLFDKAGFSRLHVVDASVFPSMVTVNICNTVMMVAERAAEFIYQR